MKKVRGLIKEIFHLSLHNMTNGQDLQADKRNLIRPSIQMMLTIFMILLHRHRTILLGVDLELISSIKEITILHLNSWHRMDRDLHQDIKNLHKTQDWIYLLMTLLLPLTMTRTAQMSLKRTLKMQVTLKARKP